LESFWARFASSAWRSGVLNAMARYGMQGFMGRVLISGTGEDVAR
jgi:hypothetical protein